MPAPAARRDGWAWLLLALVGLLLGESVAVLLTTAAAALAGQSAHLARIEREAVPPGWYVDVSLVGLWVGLVAAPVVAARYRGSGNIVSDLGLRFTPLDLLGIPVGVGAQYAIAGVTDLLRPHLHNFGAPTARLTAGSHGGSLVVVAVLTVVGAPLAEELFFRGLVFRGLCRALWNEGSSRWRRAVAVGAAVVIDGAVFGAVHGEAEQFAFLAVFGMVLALLSLRTRRLGANVLAHASFNLVAVLAVVHARGGAIL